jgi:hypothetical protein
MKQQFAGGYFMTEAEFETWRNREITQEEIDERLAHLRWVCDEFDKANAESPLPDDFIDYVKGRKFRQAVVQ